MKKYTLIIITFFSIHIYAQKQVKEGVIICKMTMSSENLQVNEKLSMMGDVFTTTFFKTNKSHTEMNNMMAGKNTTIIDVDASKMMSLIDNPKIGKKFKKHNISVSEDDFKNTTITERKDTKTILNYVCKGYDVVVNNKDKGFLSLVIYATDLIQAPTLNTMLLGEAFKGYPMFLEMNMTQGGMPMKITLLATSINAEKVANSKFSFDIPEGYSELEMPKPPSID